jgi:hypothetical protein
MSVGLLPIGSLKNSNSFLPSPPLSLSVLLSAIPPGQRPKVSSIRGEGVWVRKKWGLGVTRQIFVSRDVCVLLIFSSYQQNSYPKSSLESNYWSASAPPCKIRSMALSRA